MTTTEAAAKYLKEHLKHWEGKGWAIYNPENKPEEELPVIYGFNNGGANDWWQAQLLSSEGYGMGNHLCSNEFYMPSDLGVLEGSAPRRHDGFKETFPAGYRMEWVSTTEIDGNEGFQAALTLAKKIQEDAEAASNASVEITVAKGAQ